MYIDTLYFLPLPLSLLTCLRTCTTDWYGCRKPVVIATTRDVFDNDTYKQKYLILSLSLSLSLSSLHFYYYVLFHGVQDKMVNNDVSIH